MEALPFHHVNEKSIGCRLVDSKLWHYTMIFLLVEDFFFHVIDITFHAKLSPWYIATNEIVYAIDMSIRCLVFRSKLYQSTCTMVDYIVWSFMLALWISQMLCEQEDVQLSISLIYVLFISFRLITKPRARLFTKRLHIKANLSSGVSMNTLDQLLRQEFHLSKSIMENL